MRTAKKLSALTLCLVMLLGIFAIGSTTASAATYSGYCGMATENRITWTLDTTTGVLKFSGTGPMASYDPLGSPRKDPPWYQYRNYITAVDVLSGITFVGNYAFYNLGKLTGGNVYLPESVKYIGDGAFHSCFKIFSISLKSSVTSVGDNAFYGVGNVSYGSGQSFSNTDKWGAKAVKGYAKDNCIYRDSTMKELLAFNPEYTGGAVIYPEVETIGKMAFYNCTGVNDVRVGSGSALKIIGESAFEGCTALKYFGKAPRSLKRIEYCAFYGCSSLDTIETFMTESEWNSSVVIPYANAIPSKTVILPHTHTTGGGWVKNSEKHWKECSCGLKTNESGHSWESGEVIKPATYLADGTQEMHCTVCGYSGNFPIQKLECVVIPNADYGKKTIAPKTYLTVRITLQNVPSGAEVYIGGQKASVSGNTYSCSFGQISSKDCTVEIRMNGVAIDSGKLTVEEESGFFALVKSFFTNFLFNGFSWADSVITL